MNKDRLYSIIAFLLGLASSVLLFLTAAFGSPEGCFEAACQLLGTDTGKTLGMLLGSFFVFVLSISALMDAIFYRKKADQQEADQLKNKCSLAAFKLRRNFCMETWEVVGVDTNAQVNIKNEGKIIRGVKLFLVGDAPDENGRYRGRVCREQFLSNDRMASLKVAPMPGDIITLYFNRFGDVIKIDVGGK